MVIVNELELLSLSAVYTSAKFQEIDPPKLKSLIGHLPTDPKRIVFFEHQLLSAMEFMIQPPAEEIYIDYLVSELAINPRLKNIVLTYIKVALFFNFLRKYNPRLVVLSTMKHVIDQNFHSLKQPFKIVVKSMEIDEPQFLAAHEEFFKDFRDRCQFSKRKGLEFVVNCFENPDAV